MLTVIGKIRRAASAIRFMMIRTIETANTIASTYMMYFAVKSVFIKLYASGVLYKSGVGAGKTPRAPRIGLTRRETENYS
jgi:hypothetical protein